MEVIIMEPHSSTVNSPGHAPSKKCTCSSECLQPSGV